MMELLAVIGIIVIAAAIAIPSLIYARDTLSFQQKNDYAKTIFMAAQANLTEMRADGRIAQLQKDDLRAEGMNCNFVPIEDNADFPAEDWSAEYMYCTSTPAPVLLAEGETARVSAFDLVLPANSVESVLRDKNILIEYNPATGNVYSVFYSEGDEPLTYANVTRDEAGRKEMGLGYYCGSGLSTSIMEIVDSKVEVSYVNGEEGVIEVRIPLPEQFYESPMDFMSYLETTVTISGDPLLKAVYDNSGNATEQADPEIPTNGSYTVTISDAASYVLEDGRYVVCRLTLDSLLAGKSFGSLMAGGANLSTITSEGSFRILPGQNVTITAGTEYTDESSPYIIEIQPDALSGVNPMFEYLIESSTAPGRYVLAVSNGRNLQNLNALAPSVAEKVEAVVFTDDIHWDQTVAYYNKEYTEAAVLASGDAPVCDLPYFVPISNGELFGTAEFVYPNVTISSVDDFLDAILDALLNTSDGDVPTLSDETDSRIDPLTQWTDAEGNVKGNTYAENHAQILGMDGTKKVYGLNINTAQYRDQAHAASYYVGDVDYTFTGMFAYVNTPIYDLQLVNPIVKGYPFADETVTSGPVWLPTTTTIYANPATGALVGAAGYNTLITGCGVYIDRNDASFDSSKMTQGDYSQAVDQSWYGVSGEGAVGGLVGYAKSHRTTSGELTGDLAHLAFANCFAAVPVSGNMRGSSNSAKEAKHFGYSNGVGGFIGNSELTNFYNCYASGNVRANGAYVAKSTLSNTFGWIADLLGMTTELKYNGRTGMGAGGFVGTSHGTRYTNCFSTGNVDGTNAYSDHFDGFLGYGAYDYRTLGSGGFVGFMSYDETRLYGNDVEGTEIAQSTVFTDCYSVGRATVGTSWNGERSALENFSGGNGRVRLEFSESTNFMGNYYELYAPTYAEEGRTPNYEDYYIFRHSYYLSNYYLEMNEEDQKNSDLCSSGESYEVMIDLIGKHQDTEGWVTDQINVIKGLRNRTYDQLYFQGTNMAETYKTLYSEGFASGWCVATAENTHAYSLENVGQAYPFAMIEGLPYYGSWPEAPISAGLAYYEEYDNGTTVYFPLNSDDAAIPDNAIVTEDGYVIFIANENEAQESENTSITVQIGTITGTLTNYVTVDAADGSSAHSFNVFTLPAGYLDVQPASGEFYVKVTATRDNTTYILYFNPNAAMTQVNPPDYNAVEENGNTVIAAAKPESAPATILIRSARQFAAMDNLSGFWGDEYTYVQQLNIDAAKYTGTIDTSVTIGSAENPFAATYTGSGGYVAKAQLTGFMPETNGLFANVTGTVKDLSVGYGDAQITGTDNAGFLAGVNSGTIANVDLTLGNVTVIATENAGLLAGKNDGGTIDGCNVTAGDVTLNAANAANAGGLVGSSEGSAVTDGSVPSSSVTNCSVTLASLNAAAANAGGVVGKAENTAFENVTVTVGTFAAPGATAGGFAGSIRDGSVLVPEVTVTDASAAAFGGLAGNASTVTFENATVNAGSVTAGTAAGAIGIGQAVNVNNAAVTVTNVTGEGPDSIAGGFAGKLNNEISGVIRSAEVHILDYVKAENGTAAGFAGTLGGAVSSGKVYLGEAAPVTVSGHSAAGFAGTSTARVDACLVSGQGTIAGVSDAAGFIVTVSSDNVTNSIVTPVCGNDPGRYIQTSNAALKITGQSAAGFIVTNNGTVTTCTALGTVEGRQAAAGFIVNNNGAVSMSMANTSLPGGGSAFVLLNRSGVQNSYAWHDGGDADSLGDGETGAYYGCFFAPLTTQPDTRGVTLTVFPGLDYVFPESGETANGKKSMTVSLDAISDEMLNGPRGSMWRKSYAAYPYTLYNADGTAKVYPYPMIRAHYGDWTVPPRYAYGLVYYEEMEDGTINILQLKDISCVEEEINIHSGEITIGEPNRGEPGSAIVSAGYAIFCQNKANLKVGSIEIGEQLVETFMDLGSIRLDNDETTDDVQVFKDIYDLYVLDTTSAKVLTVTGFDDKSSVSFIPAFAMTVGNVNEPFEIRTPAQFAAIYDWNGIASYTQTHDLDLTKLENGYNSSNVADYAGNDRHIVTNRPLFNTVSGTASGIHVTVEDCEIGGVENGLLAAANKGKIENCTVTAESITLNGATETTFGGLTGTNSGTITGSSADVTITCTGASDVTIGGLVGRMDGGELKDCSVSGSIKNEGTAATAIIGGAVGRDGEGNAKYTNVTSTVYVDSGWQSTSRVDETGYQPAGKGPVGTFIGYAYNGSFTDCDTADAEDVEPNAAFHFLGEAHMETKAFSKDVWSAQKHYDSFISYRENNGGYSVIEPDGAALTKKESYIFFPAELNNCTFSLDSAEYQQTYGITEYFYQRDNEVDRNIYSSAKLTAGFGSEKNSFSYDDLIDDNGTKETKYYYKKDNTFYKLSVTRTSHEERVLFITVTYYSYELFGYDNDGNKVTLLDVKDILTPNRSLAGIYDPPTVPAISSSQQYAIVTSDGAFALGYGGSPIAWNASFRQHETLGQQAVWTYDGSGWKNSGSGETLTITNEAQGVSNNCYTSSTFDVTFKLKRSDGTYVEANSVNTFHLYSVSTTGTYKEGTFSRYSGEWDRQNLQALDAFGNVLPAPAAAPSAPAPLAETEALIPEKQELPTPDNTPSGTPGGADGDPNA